MKITYIRYALYRCTVLLAGRNSIVKVRYIVFNSDVVSVIDMTKPVKQLQKR